MAALGQAISPGVYTQIIDLSQYLADVPGTVGFVPMLCKQGPDNELTLVTSNQQYQQLFGQPNLLDYGKQFGQGPYIANQHLGVSSQLFVLRCLPSDATYAHCYMGMQLYDYFLYPHYSSSSVGIPFQTIQMVPCYIDGQNHNGAGGKIDYTISGNSVNGVSIASGGTGYLSTGTFHITVTGVTNPAQINYTANSHGVLQTVTIVHAGSGYTTGGTNYVVPGATTDPYAQTTYVLESTLRTENTEGFMNLLRTGGVGVPNGMLLYFRGIGRGDFYNKYGVRISRQANPQLFGIYILDVFELKSNGSEVIVETMTVSFDPNAVDSSGNSIFIEDVVNTFSQNVRCSVNRTALTAMQQYEMDYYKNDPILPESVTEFTVLDENGQKTDLGFKATVIEFANEDYIYSQKILENALTDLATARAMPIDTADHIIARNAAVTTALEEVSSARAAVDAANTALQNAYDLDMLNFGESTTTDVLPNNLSNGTEGALTYTDPVSGKIVVSSSEAIQILSEAYSGLLLKPNAPYQENQSGDLLPVKDRYVDEVLDLDWIYFSIVYDAGYPTDVKNAALQLTSVYRMDCMLISDCGDNQDFLDVQTAVGGNPSEPSGNIWSSRYAARYEPYNRVYDVNIGKDIWISPVYHMAQMVPLNDRLYQIWYADAGFQRATINSIKQLRWSAKLGDRDNLYLLQVNPIVHFPEGYTVWGNLTTQKMPSALQNVNVMRMVLYIKRALEQFCRYFIFEFNDQPTWDRIKRNIVPFLDTVKANRGLQKYSIEVGATEWEFQNKICHINVVLFPNEVIEKIALNLFID